MAKVVSDDLARRGHEALARHDWKAAFELLREAAEAEPAEVGTLVALAEAAFWVGRLDDSLAATEKAYARQMADGDARGAARSALNLARDYGDKRQQWAIASGWTARAERLLEDEPECAEFGHLVLSRAIRSLRKGQLDEARELSRNAADIGSRHGDRELWAVAIHIEGQAVAAGGQVAEGFRLIDEATAAAVGGELSPYTTGVVYCWTISSCHDLADYSRAGEWTDAANRWCEQQSIAGFPGICRIHRAELLRLRGALTQAETEVRSACEELPAYNPGMSGNAFAELGEIRLRVGDLAGAGEAFRIAHEVGNDGEPGHSLLHLARGQTASAVASMKRALGESHGKPFASARLLPAAVEIGLAAGDQSWADASATALEELAAKFGSAAHRAAAQQARGAVLLASGAHNEAVDQLRAGIRTWLEVDAPYEVGRCREILASAYAASGDRTAARAEFDSALACFEKLGARIDAERITTSIDHWDEPQSGTAAVRTFMFTDIVKSTSLLEAIGDEAWTALLRWHDGVLRGLFKKHGGEEVDHAGDGFFVTFADSAGAIRCAQAIQRALLDHRTEHGFAPSVRIGLHAGGARRSGKNYQGKEVHEAARIAALAKPDEILASVSTIGPRAAANTRTVHLKGISEPVAVCAVDWR